MTLLKQLMPAHQINLELVNLAPGMAHSMREFQRRYLEQIPAKTPQRMIYFVGDSTMRNIFNALCLALGAPPTEVPTSDKLRQVMPHLVRSMRLCRGQRLLAGCTRSERDAIGRRWRGAARVSAR